MVLEQVFLKCWGGEGWHFPYLNFFKFITFTFRNYLVIILISSNIVLYIWRKKIFFLLPSIYELKSLLLSKNKLVGMCKKG